MHADYTYKTIKHNSTEKLQHRLKSACGLKWRGPMAFPWCYFQEVATTLTMPLAMKTNPFVNFNFFPPPPRYLLKCCNELNSLSP